MRVRRIGAYVGIDPTARSLHIGHILTLMPLFWLYLHGYKAISLIGGSTARIGDPTGRLTGRDKLSNADASANFAYIHYQIKKLWANVESQGRKYGYEKEWAWRRGSMNNSHWLCSVSIMDFLKRAASFMRLGPMLSRDL